MEEEPRFDDVESSRAPTYEKVLEDELEDDEALLGVNASPPENIGISRKHVRTGSPFRNRRALKHKKTPLKNRGVFLIA